MSFNLNVCVLTLALGCACTLNARTALAQQAHSHSNGDRVAQLLDEGTTALARGDEQGAKVAFQNALALEPNNVAAHTYLGVIADKAGDLNEAARHFAAAAVAAPYDAAARNNYGAILVRLGRMEQARAQFEASLKLNAEQPNALVNLAQIRAAASTPEDLRAARELFAHAQRLAPDAEVARALVVIALKLGARDQAAASYRDYAALVARETDAPQVAPSVRAELGAALLEADLPDEAITELSAATQADATNADALVALARAHLKRKDVKAAGQTLEAAVARGLDAAPIYAALADVYDAGGYAEHAIPAMRLALARDPHNELYHFRYGMLLTDSSAPAAAIIRLQESLKEFPRSARLWLALGIAQLSDGKNNEAEQSFKQALTFEPQSVAALAYLGTTYAERGSYAQAVEAYERAIAADDHAAAPYYLAADTMLKESQTDYALAEKYLTRAIELDPSLASARVALAKLYVRAERWTEAAAQLERAVQLAPELTEAHYQLGRVYVRLKRMDEAQRELALFKEQSETAKQKRVDEHRELVRRLANVRF